MPLWTITDSTIFHICILLVSPNVRSTNVLSAQRRYYDYIQNINHTNKNLFLYFPQGHRLLTMSCSDKIARWNIVGIQGSLLSSIIEPIYLHSIVLGSLLHPEHMYRAVCGRIEKSIQGLPPPYHLNKPRLAQLTSSEPRNQAKAPNFGINWTVGDTEVEVVNSLTGKTVNNQISRITKQMFFNKYGELVKNLPGLPEQKLNTDYGQTKEKVKDYQVEKT